MSQAAAVSGEARPPGEDAVRSALKNRRPPAHRSVSLRHDEASNLSRDQNQSSLPVSAASSLENNHNSSGETSNADQWFEDANQKVMKDRVLGQDNEPPFFLKNNSSTESPPQDTPPQESAIHYSLQRPEITRLQSMGSSSEEYRSVIDDLTIQNKNLKRKLKKYESLHDSYSKSDKLFEIKVHGLPSNKKRQLEETLKQFALSLNKSPDSNATSGRVASAAPKAVVGKPSSSSTRFADSGYGSLSTSGQASLAQSSREGNVSVHPAETPEARNQNIHSYLHDIPEGLLPKHSTAMTEKARKKMVVRRLEEIFGGRGAAPGVHQQPMQQQEVSQTAARQDRSAAEAQGQKAIAEGIREAPIMNRETEDPMDFQKPDHKISTGHIERGSQSPNMKDSIAETDFADAKSPHVDQRPTRPLDLDPHRAQVPQENLDYIRHLGFQMSGQDSPPMDGQGWIYLNLLINMAQLHTINVTPTFVKSAITEYSRMFELSSDGRKIRWRGGKEITNNSSPSGAEDQSSSHEFDSADARSVRKRAHPSHVESASGSSEGYPMKKPHLPESVSKLAYQPLFPSNAEHGDDDDSMADDESPNSSSDAGDATGNSSGRMGSSHHVPGNSKHRDDGPIIFYNNAQFCTDLSGDKARSMHQNVAEYRSLTSHPLGATRKSSPSVQSSRASERLLANTPEQQPMDVDGKWSGDQFSFPVNNPSPKHVLFAEPERPVEFEASGLGGVRPSDNVTYTVTRQHQTNPSAQVPRQIISSKLTTLPPPRREPEPVPDTIISVRRKNLTPSALPPASYAYYSDDEEEDSDSEGSSSSSNQDDLVLSHNDELPSLATPSHTIPSAMSERDSSNDSRSTRAEPSEAEEEVDDDQSLDFLATARAANPAAVRAKEREYDAEMAERLADDIPAGSSAATAGGGSGFNSPEVTTGEEEEEQKPRGSVSS